MFEALCVFSVDYTFFIIFVQLHISCNGHPNVIIQQKTISQGITNKDDFRCYKTALQFYAEQKKTQKTETSNKEGMS